MPTDIPTLITAMPTWATAAIGVGVTLLVYRLGKKILSKGT